MGVVYAAYDPDLDRKVALKLLKSSSQTGDSSAGRTRLLREAQALAKLSHPNIVAIHDVGTIGEEVWIAMEFVSGETLKSWATTKTRDWREVVQVLTDIARGLAAAHSAGLVHRDLKPENVMIGKAGRVRVMDFGLAHGRVLADAELAQASTMASDNTAKPEVAALGMRLTYVGALLGTPAYMSPEQWEGKDAGPASDQFSWGILAWELLYGELPFAGDTTMAIAAMVISGTRRTPKKNRSVPTWLRRIADRALSTDPTSRYPTFSEIRSAIERGHGRSKRQALIAGAVALTVLVVAGESIRRDRNSAIDQEVHEQVEFARRSIADARAAETTWRSQLQESFEHYDSMRGTEGDALFRETRAPLARSVAAYRDASNILETALSLSPRRDDVEELLADVLFARVLLSDQLRDDAMSEEIIARLRLHDKNGRRTDELEAPAKIKIETEPPGALVSLARYEQDDAGHLVLGERTTLGRSPLAGLEVAPGSYRAELSILGYEDVLLPFLATRGEVLDLQVTLPAQGEIPGGYTYIPAGRSLFGYPGGHDDGSRDVGTHVYNHCPMHEVYTGSYVIQSRETTFRDYIRFLDSLDVAARAERRPVADEAELKVKGDDWILSWKVGPHEVVVLPESPLVLDRDVHAEVNWLDMPVVGVSAADAEAFGAWLGATGKVPGARLCTDVEWERAARGADDRVYPHGTTISPDEASFDLTFKKDVLAMAPTEGGSFPLSRSPFGIDDLSGNAYEWVTSSLSRDLYAIRGGGFYFNSLVSRTIMREEIDPSHRAHVIGFRMCASYPLRQEH